MHTMSEERKRDILVVLIGMVAAMLLFASCDDGEMTYEAICPGVSSTIGQFARESDTSYFIDSDRGNRYMVVNFQSLLDQGYRPGQRVYAEYTPLAAGEISVSKSFPVQLNSITEATESTADDPMDVINVWVSSHYLNVYYYFMTSGTYADGIDLVTVDAPKRGMEGYQYLELRHSSRGNKPLSAVSGIVSFEVGAYLTDPTFKGFIIKSKSLDGRDSFWNVDVR